MAGIFDGLDKFGLAEFSKVDLFTPESKAGNAKVKKAEKVFSIKDYVYAKEFECPVCGKIFTSNIVRTGKIKIDTIDYDLRPIYTPIEPMFYDAVVCTKCGYSAVKQHFMSIRDFQIDMISTQLSPKYTPCIYPDELDVDMSVERYKLVLLNSYVKKARDGEKAYICMKIAWHYRIKGDKKNELLFIKCAYDGFLSAYQNDVPPIMGLEENTVQYLLAAFSKALGNYDEAIRFISQIIVSKSASERLKERARDLKSEISQERG